MSDHLRLDRDSLCSSAELLRMAAEPLEAASRFEGFAFESVTGVAHAAHEFLRAVTSATGQLSQGSIAGAQLLTHLAERGDELDLRLAVAVETDQTQTMRRQEHS